MAEGGVVHQDVEIFCRPQYRAHGSEGTLWKCILLSNRFDELGYTDDQLDSPISVGLGLVGRWIGVVVIPA